MKRAVSLILALLMCTAVLFGCNKSNEDGETEGTVNTGEITDDMGSYDFGGVDFTILSRTSTSYEHIGEYGDDSVSSAVYQRNVAVSDRFGVNIKVVEMDGDWDSTDLTARDSFITALRAEHMAGTGAYDLVSTHSVYLGWLASEGVFADLSTLPEMKLSKEFWNQNLYDDLNVDGKCYIMIGDIAHTLYEYISVLFVNTDILENNQLVSGGINGVYDMVDAGTWTWDAMYELALKYGRGGTDLTSSESKYGLLFNTHANRAAMMSQDAYIYTKDESGHYTLAPSAGEHLLTAVDNLTRFFGAGNSHFYDDWGMAEDFLNPVFTEERALFYAQVLGESSKFSEDMGEGYAVLPLPKFNKDQGGYSTICCNMVSAIAVMSSVKSYEMSGVVTQALAMYGAEYVTPEYYERALKYRYANDPRCPEILDMIRASLTAEAVSTYFDGALSADLFRTSIVQGDSTGISSLYKEKVTAAQAQLDNFYLDIEVMNS